MRFYQQQVVVPSDDSEDSLLQVHLAHPVSACLEEAGSVVPVPQSWDVHRYGYRPSLLGELQVQQRRVANQLQLQLQLH